MKLTGEQIIDILNKHDAELQSGIKNAFGYFDGFNSIGIELGLGKSESVYHDREGCDYDTDVQVIHFKEHNVYISLSGYYSSQEGTNWDGEFKVVYPKTKTITVYEEDPHTCYGPII